MRLRRAQSTHEITVDRLDGSCDPILLADHFTHDLCLGNLLLVRSGLFERLCEILLGEFPNG
jgi:hypothetical protein